MSNAAVIALGIFVCLHGEPIAADPIVKYQSAPVDVVLFQPSPYPKGNWSPANLDYEDVWFQSKDGTKLNGWFCQAENPRAVVLYAHGNAGNVTHRASLLWRLQNRLNVSVLVFDYRGYGRSKGIPTQGGVLDDARAARTFLAKKTATTESELILMGRSMGGAIAIQLAADMAPRGLIVESTFTSLKDEATHVAPALAMLVHANDFNSLQQIKQYTGPLLHSHGDADRLIPYSQGMTLFRASSSKSKQHVRIPNGTHNSALPKSYYQTLWQFIETCSME